MRTIKSIALAGIAALGLWSNVAKADRLSDMISPITDPTNFEDPRNSTEIRPIYLYHKFDKDFVTQGGSVQVYALQLRYALSEDLSIIANKDGYIVFLPDAALNDESGLGNLGAGVKYSFLRDGDAGTILSGILTYEAPTGDEEVFHGQGDGFIKPSISGAIALGENTNFMAESGLRIPIDSADSTFWDFNFHVDQKICNFYPLLEVSVVQVLDGGERLPIPDEGLDYFSFGSSKATGETIVTGTVGGRYRFTDNLDWGLGYQFPLTTGEGSNVTAWRLSTDLIVRF